MPASFHRVIDAARNYSDSKVKNERNVPPASGMSLARSERPNPLVHNRATRCSRFDRIASTRIQLSASAIRGDVGRAGIIGAMPVSALYHLEDDWRVIVENSDLLSEKQQQQQTALWELAATEMAYIKTLKVVTDVSRLVDAGQGGNFCPRRDRSVPPRFMEAND